MCWVREDLRNVEIRTSNPIVSFCEGVGGRSGASSGAAPEVVCAKSPNNLNCVFVTMEPLSVAVCAAIEAGPGAQGDEGVQARDGDALFRLVELRDGVYRG